MAVPSSFNITRDNPLQTCPHPELEKKNPHLDSKWFCQVDNYVCHGEWKFPVRRGNSDGFCCLFYACLWVFPWNIFSLFVNKMHLTKEPLYWIQKFGNYCQFYLSHFLFIRNLLVMFQTFLTLLYLPSSLSNLFLKHPNWPQVCTVQTLELTKCQSTCHTLLLKSFLWYG